MDSSSDVAEVWDTFCERLARGLKSAGSTIVSQAADRLDRDEGLRVLLRDLRISIERQLEEGDTDFPIFSEVIRDTYHLIADTPDYTIHGTWISGEKTYVLRGKLGSADTINFTTHGPDPISGAAPPTGGAAAEPPMFTGPPAFMAVPGEAAGGGRTVITGKLEQDDLEVDGDGRFEILVSREQPSSGAWLPIAANTNRITVRNIFHSSYRKHRRFYPALIHLERVDGPAAPEPFSQARLGAALSGICAEVGRTASRAGVASALADRGIGDFSGDSKFWAKNGANPRTYFQQAYWQLEPGEAMLVELDSVPPASYWILDLTNSWMESLDFRYHSTYVNSFTAKRRSGGGLTVVLSDIDPGCENWLDTAGHRRGTMVWRWSDLLSLPEVPRTRVVPIGDHVFGG